MQFPIEFPLLFLRNEVVVESDIFALLEGDESEPFSVGCCWKLVTVESVVRGSFTMSCVPSIMFGN